MLCERYVIFCKWLVNWNYPNYHLVHHTGLNYSAWDGSLSHGSAQRTFHKYCIHMIFSTICFAGRRAHFLTFWLTAESGGSRAAVLPAASKPSWAGLPALPKGSANTTCLRHTPHTPLRTVPLQDFCLAPGVSPSRPPPMSWGAVPAEIISRRGAQKLRG